VERYNLKNVNSFEVKEEYEDKISNSFSALRNLDDDVVIDGAGVNMSENMKGSDTGSQSYYEVKRC
jgi:cobyric acid synthase